MVELLALFAGSGTGLIGSITGRIANFFEAKQKLKEKQLDYDHEVKLHNLNAQERAADREAEERMHESVEDVKALGISMQHDTSYGDSLLRWVRPILTVLLMILTTIVYMTIPDEITKSDISLQIIYLTSMAVSWWFADRSKKK